MAIVFVIGLFAYFHVGSGFMPAMDEGGFILDYIAPPGTSLADTDRMLGEVEKIIRATPEVETYSRRTGTQLGGGLTEANTGDYFIRLKPLPRRGIEEVMADIQHQVEDKVPGLANRNRAVDGGPDRRSHGRAAADRDQAVRRRRRGVAQAWRRKSPI